MRGDLKQKNCIYLNTNFGISVSEVTIAGTKTTKRGKAIRNIARDARTLGVSHSHLWRVLHGQRQSGSLLERYTQLVATRAANSQKGNTNEKL